MNRNKHSTANGYDGRKVPPGHRVAPWSGPGRSGFKASSSRRARQLSGLLAAVVMAAWAILAWAQTGEEYSLSQVTFSGGGGVSTSVEGYHLFTIIGEHTAGQASGDGYTMLVGSLPGLIDDQPSLIPDIDGDGDGDLRDVSIFQDCFHAEVGAGDPGLCDAADLNGNGIVDLGDLPGLVLNMTGPRPLRFCGTTPPGLQEVKIEDRDLDGDVDGDDVLEALKICHQVWQGCVLKAPAGIIDNVAVQIGVDGFACNQTPCYPNGLIIEGQGQQWTVFRSKVGSLADPLHPVFWLLPNAPDGVIFRHMTIDGRKLEQPAEGQGWSRIGGTGLPHPSWPSLISTENVAAALNGHGGLVCDVELRNSIRFGVILEFVDNWTIRDNFIHDMGCHVDMTPCSPAIHAMRNLHEQYGTCVGPGPGSGDECFPINPTGTANTSGCHDGNVCTITGGVFGSEGMCEGFGPGSGNLCYPVGSAHSSSCNPARGECCDDANICKSAGFVGRRSSGFGVLLTGGVDNTLVQDNVFTRTTKYNGIFYPPPPPPAGKERCDDPNAPHGNVFYNNQAYDDANFTNNGGCAGTEFFGNSVDGSHMLRNECPHGCSLGWGFGAGLGGDGARWINNVATNNRGSGFLISSVDDVITLGDNRSEYNCRGNTGLAAAGVWFASYDVGGFYAPPMGTLLQFVTFVGNTSVDDGMCDSALFVRNVDGITLEGGSHTGAEMGAYLNHDVNAVEFRDMAFTVPQMWAGPYGLYLFHGNQDFKSAQDTLVQANVTFSVNYADEIFPIPPDAETRTIRCTNIGMSTTGPNSLCTEPP